MDDLTRHLAAAREWSPFPKQAGQLRLPRMLSVGQCCPAALRGSHSWSLSDFRMLKRVGEGALSEVYQAQHILSGTSVAVKLYAKASLTLFTRRQIEREVQLQSTLQHPHIVQLYGAFEDSHHIVLVEEYASMGNLLKHITRLGSLSEAHIVQNVMQPLLQALQHLHAQGILHRDLKPENLLLAGGILKLADFGTAINVRDERAVSRVGTLDQMAPEVLACPDRSDPELHKQRDDLAYGTPSDIWAVGALAQELLMGASPFAGLAQQEIIQAILTGAARAPSPALSAPAQAFLSACLQRDPAARPSVSDLLTHPWIQGAQPDIRPLLLSQSSVGSSVERHSSEESETIVCSLPISPSKGDVSSASPARLVIVRASKSLQARASRQHGRPLRFGPPLLH